MHHPAQKYILYSFISGATPLARIDQSIALPHHRTSAYPMQQSSRVGVHGTRTGKAEITNSPTRKPSDGDQNNEFQSGSSRLVL